MSEPFLVFHSRRRAHGTASGSGHGVLPDPLPLPACYGAVVRRLPQGCPAAVCQRGSSIVGTLLRLRISSFLLIIPMVFACGVVKRHTARINAVEQDELGQVHVSNSGHDMTDQQEAYLVGDKDMNASS